ncbi:MAG: cation diffusion facilitator family transporter [Gammaproteobacteria bacterium]|nr:cation diffusion facilitator family transporter [Gammaproteobacteria bacterium]MCF6362811.1 cation diffusion facilitator family transporter [Gammaproteobacteria bacterium]
MSAPSEHAPLTHDERYREARHVTLVGSAVDLVLGVTKIFVGFVGNSQALIADGVHSLSDLATDIIVLFAMKHGSRAADEEHPYGHGRIETLATVVLGVALLAVAIGIAYDASLRLLNPELLPKPGWLALSVATISIAAKEAIYHYTLRVANRLNSQLLRANAWHSRSDAISSLVVVIGVIGAMNGVVWLDAVAAITVGAMVGKIGIGLAWHSSQELIDRAMEPEQVTNIRTAILSVNGVKALHMLRTRRMANDGLVDVHILVEPKSSVSEGHLISERVRQAVMEKVDGITEVMVHIDPEDDEVSAPSHGLPMRDEVLTLLRQRWQDIEEASNIEHVRLHYLDGKIHVEVSLPLEKMRDIAQARALAQQLVRLAEEEDNIADIQVSFY